MWHLLTIESNFRSDLQSYSNLTHTNSDFLFGKRYLWKNWNFIPQEYKGIALMKRANQEGIAPKNPTRTEADFT